MEQRLSMTVGMKLTAVFLFLAALIGLSGYEGHRGILQLGEVLEMVSGPAWDAANGMMDIRIAMGEEGLLVQRLVASPAEETGKNPALGKLLAELRELDTLIGQRIQSILDTHLFRVSEEEELQRELSSFGGERDAFLNSDQAFDRSEAVLQRSFTDFQAFMRRLLEYVEEEREKERSASENSGLEGANLGEEEDDLLGALGNIGSQMATDSALDTYVSLLELNHQYQKMVEVFQTRVAQGKGSVQKEVQRARKKLQARVDSLRIQDVFDVPVPGSDQTWAESLIHHSEGLSRDFDQASGDLNVFSRTQATYQNAVLRLNRILERLEAVGDSKIEGQKHTIEGANREARRGILVSLLLGALAAVFAAIYVFIYISRPLRRISLAMSAFAEGKSELEIPKHVGGQDEIGELIRVLHVLIDRMNARRESFRSLSLEHATSVRQTVATVRELRETATRAQRIASDTLSHADEGLVAGKEGAMANNLTREGLLKLARRVDAMGETISGLTEKIRQIDKIAGTVNDLSEQSKFLSLNAAIEAARAGEHGRGFGVVAVEVRMLAQQSQEATLEISRLIAEITERAGEAQAVAEEGRREARHGEDVLSQTEGAISKLSEALRSSHDASNKLLASSNQQAVGVDQIALAMEEIDAAVGKILVAADAG
jgi:methyl-accepting chemotaxis protein